MKRLLSTTLAGRLWLRQNKALQTALLACVGLLAMNLALLFAMVRPLAADLAERESRIAGLRKHYAAAVQFQQQKKALGGIPAMVPTQKDMPLLVKELGQTARNFNLRLGSVDYEIPRGAEGITMLSFSFPVAGRYADLKRFIYEVETSRRLVGIEALELKAGRGWVDLDLKLIAYVRG